MAGVAVYNPGDGFRSLAFRRWLTYSRSDECRLINLPLGCKIL